MKRSFHSSSSALALLLGTLALIGCGGAVSFSNPGSASVTAPTAPELVAGPPVSGSVFGGHSPVQGAHVYLLQPGTSGYGSLATSILGTGTTTTPGGYPLATDTSDPNVPVGSQYVTSDSSGQFSLTGAYKCAVGQPVYMYAWGGFIGGGFLKNNNIVQLLTLGNCPSSGNFSTGSGALQFVYLNEVSTVATAYTFQPFTLLTNNDAWHIGTGNTTQGLLGIANAASTAAQLYNIQGGTNISTSGDGEGHLANYRTQNGSGVSNVGNGVVPEATIDTLANILADCVDSTPATVGVPTTECAALFKVATNDGESGKTIDRPTDTGTAAINIARFPAGNHSAGTTNVDATYVHDLYVLQTGTTPYVPQLVNQPNDWTLVINYPYTPVGGYLTSNVDVERAESVQVDELGQIWITAQGGTLGGVSVEPTADRWSPLGVYNAQNTANYIYGYVSVDGSNNAWTGNADSTTGIFFDDSNGVFNTTYGSGYSTAYTVVTNKADDAFFFALTTGTNGTSPNYAMFEYALGGTLVSGSPFNISSSSTTTTTNVTLTITSASVATSSCGLFCTTYTYTFKATNTGTTPLAAGDPVTLAGLSNTHHWNTLNGAQTVGIANSTSFTITNTAFHNISGSSTGTAKYSYTTTTTTPGAIPGGENVAHGAIDSNANLWITTEATPYTIANINSTGTPQFTSITSTQQPEFPAIDGSNDAWIPTQATASTIYKVTPAGVATILTSATTGAVLTSTFGSAVDGNGNIWFANRCGNFGMCGTATGRNTIFVLNGGTGTTPGTTNTAISPSTNYVPEAQYPATATGFTTMLNDSLNVAIDPSGNVWITNYLGNSVTEFVGAAAPVVTPLSLAAGNNQLGAKP